ncbi:hypothetical protein [Prosthecobacter sp.]|uniref:hypothetical protein n=1 Tax=Prosthecobacter sp. TaxID=1965333 RepID=UPI0037840953
MKASSQITRFAVLASSLTLLTGYVVYSHHSARDLADTMAERPLAPLTFSASGDDPIAALAASSSHDLQVQSALDERPGNSIWMPDTTSSTLRTRGSDGSASESMPTLEKLVPKHFQSKATEQRIMAGSKSGQLFSPFRPLIDPPPVQSTSPDLFHFNSFVPAEAIAQLHMAERVLGGDGSGWGMSGRIRSHEKLPTDFPLMRTMGSSSKSLIVFPPTFFQLSPPAVQPQGSFPSNP